MNYFARVANAILGRDIKAADPVPMGRHRYGWVSGVGLAPQSPGARADYASLVGDLSANSVVAVCLGWIRDTMPQSKLVVGTETKGERTPDETSVLAYKLKTKPNPVYSWRQTWGATSDSFKVDGNAYWLKARDDQSGLLVDWYWVPNAWLRIRVDSLGFVEAYEYWPNGSYVRDYLPEDVIHFRDGIDPLNPVLGISRLKRVLRSVAGVNAGETYTAAILRNMGVANALLIPPDNGMGWDDKERTGLVRALGSQIRGESAGSLAAVSMPMRVENIGMSPEDVALDRILDRPEAMICAAIGVNALVTGLPASDASRTYSNLAEASRLAWENGIIPMQDMFVETMRDSLVSEYDLPEDTIIYWDRSNVEALSEQADAKATRAVSLYQAGLLPQNRCLRIADEEPIEGGDDRYYNDPTPKGEAQIAKDQEAYESQMAEGQIGGPELGDDGEEAEFDQEPSMEATAQDDDDIDDDIDDEDDDLDTFPSYKGRGGVVGRALKRSSQRVKRPGSPSETTQKRTTHAGGDANFDESKHPRQSDGKFASKGGTSHAQDARHPKAANQPQAANQPRKSSKPRSLQSDSSKPSSLDLAPRSRRAPKFDPNDPRLHPKKISPGSKVASPEHAYSKVQEDRIAAILGGASVGRRNGRDLAVDVVLPKGADRIRHAIEVKTMMKGGKPNITMHDDALFRKVQYAIRRPNRVVHTVVIDHRDTYGSGKFANRFSGHHMYYKRGTGPFRMKAMYPVKDEAELARLVRMKDEDLPEIARTPAGWPPSGQAFRKLKKKAVVAHDTRLNRDTTRKRRVAAELKRQKEQAA